MTVNRLKLAALFIASSACPAPNYSCSIEVTAEVHIPTRRTQACAEAALARVTGNVLLRNTEATCARSKTYKMTHPYAETCIDIEGSRFSVFVKLSSRNAGEAELREARGELDEIVNSAASICNIELSATKCSCGAVACVDGACPSK